MSIRSKILAAAAAVSLAGISFSAAAMFTAGAAQASTPLPAYPATTTLDLASPYCITDDVIMNDPLDSTSPIIDTYGGTDGVISHATPAVHYFLWYLSNSNVWQYDPPPGTQINPTTGEISSYNGTFPAGTVTGTAPNSEIVGGPSAANTSVTYTVRDHGKDTLGAIGTEQFQLRVNNSGGIPNAVTVSYEGNTFNNANGALTIGLNAGSTDSTTLTLSAIASSLNIPEVGGVGSTPVTFTLVNTTSGWKLNGGTTGTVLTGISASDPEIEATTADHDVVFFTLSGISTTSAGVFYINNDANPCVNTTPPPAPVPTPTSTSTTTPPPPAPVPGYGDFVNRFGNGWDVFRQYAAYGTPVVGWPATQSDPATHFLQEPEGSGFRLEYAPHGTGTGLCVSAYDGVHLALRPCNSNIWQRFYQTGPGSDVHAAVNGGIVNPSGTGGPLLIGTADTPWGGSAYTWTDYSSLPA